MSIQHDVKDLNLADAGREAIEWADCHRRDYGHELCEPDFVRQVEEGN